MDHRSFHHCRFPTTATPPLVTMVSHCTSTSTTASRSPRDVVTEPSFSPVVSILSMATANECVAEIDEFTHIEDCRPNACTSASDSDSDCDSSYVASTIDFGHETFPTFQTKVSQIATAIFPHVDPSHITTEHMKGGSFNRVASITIVTPPPNKFSFPWFLKVLPGYFGRQKVTASKKFVVRIPRYDSAGMDRDISIIEFVGPRLRLPIIVTTAFELSDDTVLGKAWMLQPRLRGEQLSRVWETLSLAQKISMTIRVTNYTALSWTSRLPMPEISSSAPRLPSAPRLQLRPSPSLA